MAKSARLATLAALAAFTLAAGCGRQQPPPPAPAPAPPGRTGTALLSGTVRFRGAVPPAARTKVSSDPFCAKEAGTEVADESLLVSPSGGLSNVLVRVREGIEGRYAPPAAPALLDQKGCAFHPRVLGLVAGQELTIRSEDATLHNVHARAEKNPSFNLAMPSPGTQHTRRFDVPEVAVAIRCDVHGWMRAFVAVVPHPFFAVTDGEGRWTIPGLPSGTFTLEAWHETLGRLEKSVTLTEGAPPAPAQDFTFARDADPAPGTAPSAPPRAAP